MMANGVRPLSDSEDANKENDWVCVCIVSFRVVTCRVLCCAVREATTLAALRAKLAARRASDNRPPQSQLARSELDHFIGELDQSASQQLSSASSAPSSSSASFSAAHYHPR